MVKIFFLNIYLKKLLKNNQKKIENVNKMQNKITLKNNQNVFIFKSIKKFTLKVKFNKYNFILIKRQFLRKLFYRPKILNMTGIFNSQQQ